MKKQLFVILVLLAGISGSMAQTNGESGVAPRSPDTANLPGNSSTVSQRLVLPAGTTIEIRVTENLSSETAQSGDRFTGMVSSDVVGPDGRVLIARNADVSGRVLEAKPSGRLSDSGELQLTIQTIRSGAYTTHVTVDPFVIKGQSHTKSNTAKIGGGAALGALIGAIAGGGKGAAIGAGVGGAAGAGTAAATGKREAKVESEALLKFVTSTDTTIGAEMQKPSSGSGNSHEEGIPQLRRRDQDSDANGSASGSQNQNPAQAQNTTPQNPPPNAAGNNQTDYRSFSARDRRAVSTCLLNYSGSLPQGTINPPSGQPSDLDRQIVKGGTLPKALQSKVRSLPLECDRELPALPNDLERVVYGGQVMLLDSNNTILDVFDVKQQ